MFASGHCGYIWKCKTIFVKGTPQYCVAIHTPLKTCLYYLSLLVALIFSLSIVFPNLRGIAFLPSVDQV